MIRTPDPRSIEKCLLGIVPDLDALFEDFLYCPMRHLGGNNGTTTDHPPGYFFLSSEIRQIRHWGDNMHWPLYAKPRPHVREAVENRCTPLIAAGRNGWSDTELIGAFHIIPWRHVDHALVGANDRNHIASPWIAFVPLDALPEINGENTRSYTP